MVGLLVKNVLRIQIIQQKIGRCEEGKKLFYRNWKGISRRDRDQERHNNYKTTVAKTNLNKPIHDFSLIPTQIAKLH